MASSLENSAHHEAAEEVGEHGEDGGEGEEEGITGDVASSSVVEEELSVREGGKGPHHHLPPPLPPLDMPRGVRIGVSAQTIRNRRRGPKGAFLEAMEEMGNGSMDSLEFIMRMLESKPPMELLGYERRLRTVLNRVEVEGHAGHSATLARNNLPSSWSPLIELPLPPSAPHTVKRGCSKVQRSMLPIRLSAQAEELSEKLAEIMAALHTGLLDPKALGAKAHHDGNPAHVAALLKAALVLLGKETLLEPDESWPCVPRPRLIQAYVEEFNRVMKEISEQALAQAQTDPPGPMAKYANVEWSSYAVNASKERLGDRVLHCLNVLVVPMLDKTVNPAQVSKGIMSNPVGMPDDYLVRHLDVLYKNVAAAQRKEAASALIGDAGEWEILRCTLPKDALPLVEALVCCHGGEEERERLGITTRRKTAAIDRVQRVRADLPMLARSAEAHIATSNTKAPASAREYHIRAKAKQLGIWLDPSKRTTAADRRRGAVQLTVKIGDHEVNGNFRYKAWALHRPAVLQRLRWELVAVGEDFATFSIPPLLADAAEVERRAKVPKEERRYFGDKMDFCRCLEAVLNDARGIKTGQTATLGPEMLQAREQMIVTTEYKTQLAKLRHQQTGMREDGGGMERLRVEEEELVAKHAAAMQRIAVKYAGMTPNRPLGPAPFRGAANACFGVCSGGADRKDAGDAGKDDGDAESGAGGAAAKKKRGSSALGGGAGSSLKALTKKKKLAGVMGGVTDSEAGGHGHGQGHVHGHVAGHGGHGHVMDGHGQGEENGEGGHGAQQHGGQSLGLRLSLSGHPGHPGHKAGGAGRDGHEGHGEGHVDAAHGSHHHGEPLAQPEPEGGPGSPNAHLRMSHWAGP